MFGSSRGLAFATLCLGTLMVILDGTIVAVALPSIQADLGFTQPNLAWVVNGYLISFGGVLLLAGRLGDLLGRARVFLAGMVLFTVASLACGLAGQQLALVAARFAQGLGAALVSATALGMIVVLFDEPTERARAIGVFSFIGAGGASIGIIAGGVLTQLIGWHWIFIVNVPIGLLAVGLATRVLPRARGTGVRAGADVAGAVLVTVALMTGVYAIVQATDNGWGSPRTLAPLGVA